MAVVITHTKVSTQIDDGDSNNVGSNEWNAAHNHSNILASDVMTTRGDMLRRGSSAVERVAIGAAGKFLGWDGTDAVWQELMARQLAGGTFSAAATLDLTLATGYKLFRLVLNNVRLSVSTGLWLRTSTDGGSSFQAGASTYRYVATVVGSVTGWQQGRSTGTTQVLMHNHSNAANNHFDAEITLFDPLNSGKVTLVGWRGALYSGETWTCMGTGQRVAAEANNAIRLLPASGTFSGTYSLFGMR